MPGEFFTMPHGVIFSCEAFNSDTYVDMGKMEEFEASFDALFTVVATKKLLVKFDIDKYDDVPFIVMLLKHDDRRLWCTYLWAKNVSDR